MTPLIAVLFAIMQGATELFPVSSLGHAVIVPTLLHWHIDQHAASFLPFVVMLHVGTATALLAYFWRDWWDMLMGVLGCGGRHGRRVRELPRCPTLSPAGRSGGMPEARL